MNTVVIEHVALNDLPPAWRARLSVSSNARVTVRIEEEADEPEASPLASNPLFGMWQDRDDLGDVEAHVRELRTPRYHLDGSRRND